jgi:hypothetical protein
MDGRAERDDTAVIRFKRSNPYQASSVNNRKPVMKLRMVGHASGLTRAGD